MLRHGRILVCSALGVLALLLVGGSEAAHADTFTVTTAEDTQTSFTCTPRVCSLRAAIIAANQGTGGHTIAFNIAPGGLQTIRPYAPFSPITRPVLIDGTTQPGFRGTPVIEIDGSLASRNADPNEEPSGLNVLTNNAVIQGLVINRWSRSGIWIEGASNRIEGNFLGTDATGTQARANGTGITILTGSANVIGGTIPAKRNLISGNTRWGVIIDSASNRVEGNYIGTDVSGSQALGNGVGGVDVFIASSSTVGGFSAEARNVISGNGGPGVRVTGGQFVRVVSNYIGLAQNGSTPLGNNGDGVVLVGFVRDTLIGGAGPGWGNRIGYNTGAGIRLPDDARNASNNRFQANDLRENGRLGIDIGPEGVTPNDAGDGDAGPNNLQNFPIVLSAGSGGQAMTVTATLDSQPGSYEIEFFLNPTGGCDPSGNGEAFSFLGRMQVTVGRQPAWFQMQLPPAVVNQFITATATRLDPRNTSTGLGETSELSPCQRIVPREAIVTAASLTTSEAGGQATFTVQLSSHPTSDVHIAIVSQDTTEGTVSTSALTFTPQNATTPQTVIVTGADDALLDGNVQYTIATSPLQTTDPGYVGLDPLDLTMTNLDNDSP
jgi:CSLREA domain-containing protein